MNKTASTLLLSGRWFFPLAILGMTTGVHAAPTELSSLEQSTPVIAIDSGPIQGRDDGELLSWEGIPYAAPPVGDLRWRPPQPVEPWRETYQTQALGDQCIQNSDLGAFATTGGSENCLYLNVYAEKQALAAARQAGKSLPVFVWFHGGSLWVGQSGDYDPRRLAHEGKAIVVTLNYRLGMFGFFAHPAITAEEHPSSNYGQMDQSFALDWVQRNIAAFGGDPQNVTIAGESSGGTSVIAQVVSPWSASKFQHAIVMSGAAMMLRHPNFGAPLPLSEAEARGEGFAEAVNCDESERIAGCLRELTPGQILAKQTPYLINQTIIDGDFMPEHPADAFREGRFNRVTLVNGSTRDEGRFFVALPEIATGESVTKDTYPAAVAGFFGDSLGPKVQAQYPPREYNSPSEALATATTDYLFACPGARLSELATKWTGVYAYEFIDRTAPSYLEPTTFPLDAAHTFELSYLFPGFHGGKLGRETMLNPLQKELSREMVRYWTGVAVADGWQDWPEYNTTQKRMLSLSLPEPQVIDGERFAADHQCEFWDQAGVY